MEDSTSEIAKVAAGGLWNDQNLAETIEWKGDKGGKPEPDPVQHTRQQSRHEERTEILKEAGISIETLRALSETLEERILQTSGFSSKSFKGAFHSIINESEQKTRQWITANSTPTVETIRAEVDPKIQGLIERVAMMERKFDELVLATTNRDATELDIVREAAAIIVQQRRDDANTGETPSEVHRMETRADDLEIRLQRLRQITTANVPKSPISRDDKKKKLNKLF